jgi:predicted glutamine amidotransferase
MIRKELPALTGVHNGALQKEADKQARKKPPQKETISGETKTKATTGRS